MNNVSITKSLDFSLNEKLNRKTHRTTVFHVTKKKRRTIGINLGNLVQVSLDSRDKKTENNAHSGINFSLK